MVGMDDENGPTVPDWGLPPIDPAQVALGALVILAALLLARGLGMAVRWLLRRRGRSHSYAQVFGTLAAWAVGILGVGVGLTIAFPSVQPVDVLGGLGIVSIAAGIAFQGILSNLLAGVLILVREPFRIDDQIAVSDIRGTVEGITLRETIVRTFDGRRVLIPNSTVHNEILTVQTGYEKVRTSVVVGVAYDTDLAEARALAIDTMSGLPMVATDPAPQALAVEMGSSTVNIEARFWSGARQLETLEARDAVIAAIVQAFNAEGIEMPADIRVLESGESLAAALRRGSAAD